MVRACSIADSILSLDTFWLEIRNSIRQRITNSTYTMRQLADSLQVYKGVTDISLFPEQDEGRVIAITSRANQIDIYKAGLDQSVLNLALTLIHEWVHSVDYGLNPDNLQFAHRRPQFPFWNRNTASYRFQKIAIDLMSQEK